MGLRGTTVIVLLGLAACVLAAKEVSPNFTHARPTLIIGGGPHPPPPHPGSEAAPQQSKRAAAQVLTPAQIVSAYGMSGWSATSTTYGAGKTIAIIDAYNCSYCESNLATFTAQWGLSACTTANGCFKKVTQTGATTGWPADDTTSNWGFEAVMDIQAAHAMAPAAKILLIVCNSASYADLFTGVTTAISLGANVISMSWGGGEAASLFTTYDPKFTSTSIGYFASTGDSGSAGGIIYPSSSSKVIAVGGTTLYTNSGAWTTGAYEGGWTGSGGGCSAFTASLTVQSSYSGYACSGKKEIPDVSLLADPASGMYTYYSGLLNGSPACTPPSCWFGGGGTSLAAPLLAARAAARGILPNPTSVYSSGYSFRDITVGNNGGFTCGVGLDKVTGVGSLLG